MRKGASRVFQILQFRKLKLVYLALIAVLLSGGFFSLSFRSPAENSLDMASKINTQCRDDSSNRCLKSFFADFAKENSFNQTKQVLDALQEINPTIRYCHPFAHVISIAEVEKNAEGWLDVFSYIPESECSYGYFHGVIEGKYRSDPDFLIDSGFIESVCSRDLKKSGFSRSCAHAFGHVVLVQEEGSIENGLGICEKLLPDLNNPCLQGVFMENIQKDNLSEHGIKDRETWDVNFLNTEIAYCNQFNGSKQNECWRSLGPVIRAVSEVDKAVLVCQDAPEYLSRRFCTREVLGSELVFQFSQSGEEEKYSDECLFLSDQNQEYRNCMKDLISYVILTSASYKSEMLRYCEIVLAKDREDCISIVKSTD